MTEAKIRELSEKYLQTTDKPEVIVRSWGDIHESHSGTVFVECMLRVDMETLKKLDV